MKRRFATPNNKLLKRTPQGWRVKDTKSGHKEHNDGSKIVPQNKMAVRSHNRDTRSRKEKRLAGNGAK